MENLPINKIRIQGWKSIKDTEIELDNINILIGANGAGKSSFLSIFELLRVITNDDQKTNDNNLKYYIEKNGGANAIVHYGTKTTSDVFINIQSGNKNYPFGLLSVNDDRLIVKSWQNSLSQYELEDRNTTYNKTNNIRETKTLLNGNINNKYSDEENYQNAVSLLKNTIVYHFNDTGDTSPLKRTCDIDENRYLFPDGANLAAIIYKIKNEHPAEYRKIINAVKLILPTFKDFIFNITKDSVKLRWQDKYNLDYTFPLSALSDGTLRFIALSVLLNQPEPQKLIIIDEPELGLHPEAVTILSEMIKLASVKSQIIISTQSVDLINCFEPKDILITENKNGETQIKRQNPDELKEWLKDYTLGDIWLKNLIGGNP